MPAHSVPRAAAIAFVMGLTATPIALAEAPADTDLAGTASPAGMEAAAPFIAPDGTTVAPALTDAHEAVRAFYAQRHDAPVWHDGKTWTPAAAAAVSLLRDAHTHGLRPADYLPEDGDQFLTTPPTDRADVALTRGVLRYLRDVTADGLPPRNGPGTAIRTGCRRHPRLPPRT